MGFTKTNSDNFNASSFNVALAKIVYFLNGNY